MTHLLHELLHRSAEREPERTAVVHGTQALTYGELEERSNRLARALIANGCRTGDRVAILMSKSLEAVIAVYGVMKAGAAYVPLDARAPIARLRYIIADCGVRHAITSRHKLRYLAEASAGIPLERALVLDGEPDDAPTAIGHVVGNPEIESFDGASPPSVPLRGADLAYILYTSGSTGSPKGVMISHETSLSFVRWAATTLHVTRTDRVSSHAPLHFDLSIFDLFAACDAGATVALVPDGTSTFPRVLADWIATNEISIWYSVPSILSLMVVHGQLARHGFPALRKVLFAGEVFPIKYLRAWMLQFPTVEFYNLYGPTETNVITYYRVPEPPAESALPVPIGLACAGAELFALADDGTEVSRPGQEGELYACGACVADGYWGDPAKTASVFVPDPRMGDRQRAYRTGDIVTIDDAGNFIFVGRRDHMVKSRGYRIELGEIESALQSLDAVKDAAVVAVPDDLIGHRLEAFVEPAGEGVAGKVLLAAISERLPRYMVPEDITFVDRLPRTSTGKVDRGELSLRARGGADVGRAS